MWHVDYSHRSAIVELGLLLFTFRVTNPTLTQNDLFIMIYQSIFLSTLLIDDGFIHVLCRSQLWKPEGRFRECCCHWGSWLCCWVSSTCSSAPLTSSAQLSSSLEVNTLTRDRKTVLLIDEWCYGPFITRTLIIQVEIITLKDRFTFFFFKQRFH